MFNNLKIGTKILIAFTTVAIVAVGLVGFFAFTTGSSTLEAESFNKLTAVREMKASQIEDYFQLVENQVITLSEDRMIIEAMREFDEGLHAVEGDLGLTEFDKGGIDARLENYYQQEFLPRLIPNLLKDVSVDDYWPEDDRTRILQDLYISSNPFETGSKHLLDNPDDGSSYSQAHETYHPIIRDFLEKFGYYDIFLVDVGSGGHIAYSVFKEVDYGTSLLEGPYADTNFADAYNAARGAADKDFVKVVDFEPYAPSYNAPVAFIASPIFDGDEKIGVLVFQFPVDRINNVMTSNQDWSAVGLGESGETYIVGDDFLLRNQSRFLIEDSENYFRLIDEIGTPLTTIARIRNINSTIGLQEVGTDGTEAALSGETGTAIFPDYRGVPVLSSYTPLNIKGVNWVIMSEIDQQEAFAAIRSLGIKTLIGVLGLIAAIIVMAVLFSRTITRPLDALTETADELAKGNLDVEVAGKDQGDEIGELACSFDSMRISMKDLIGDLEDINRNLEQKVDERTAALELANERVRSVIESAPDAIITIDSDQNIVMFNPSAEKTFGYKADEAIGQPLTMLMPLSALEIHPNQVKGFMNNDSTIAYMENRPGVNGLRRDGTIFPAEASIAKMMLGSEQFFTAILRDVTERKYLEGKLRENALSAQLMHRSSELATAAETVENALQMVLDEICKLTGWPVGHVYALDKAEKQTRQLHPTAIWSLSDPDEYAEFRRVTEITTFLEGIGLPGRVLESGEVAWISNVQEDLNFPRRELTPNLVVKGAFGVPVKVFGNLEAVLEFFSDQVVEPEEDLINIMTLVADQLSRVFERRQMEEIMREQKERMEIELNFAREIQMNMLPLIFPAFPKRKEVSVYATLEPAREVGGDFYDFYFIDDDQLCFVVGDVAGKGAPGALLMAVSKTLIKSRAADDHEPASILTHVNDELSRDNESSMFVTVFLGIINVKTGILEYTNAGHNPPYIKRSDGLVEKVGAFHGPVIGAMPGLTYKQDSTRFRKGDIILLYTDGVTETFDENEQLFSEQRLEDLLKNENLDSTEKIIKTTLSEVMKFQGEAEQADDITILAVQYNGLLGEAEVKQLRLTIKNRLEDLGVVEEHFYDFAEQNDIPDTVRQKVSMVLDEMLNNIISYAYQDEEEHDVDIDIELYGNRLVTTLKDEGVPFNPFGMGTPDVSASVEERKIGGLGIHLVRSVMDEYLYQRQINKNVVTLVKFIEK